MEKRLRSLRHFERCIFSAWCAEHLLESHAPLIEENLSKAHLRILREILGVIWEFLLDGSIPKADVLNELDDQFMQAEPDDPIEVDPIVVRVLNAIGICILGCRRNDVGLAQTAGENVIEVLDSDLDDGDSNSTEDFMFEHPAMKKELEAQLAMVRYLRGEYVLDGSLSSKFRD
jgi:hypothetical protein